MKTQAAINTTGALPKNFDLHTFLQRSVRIPAESERLTPRILAGPSGNACGTGFHFREFIHAPSRFIANHDLFIGQPVIIIMKTSRVLSLSLFHRAAVAAITTVTMLTSLA